LYKSLAKTLFVGKNVIFLPSCHSTNDEAINYLQDGRLSEGAIVITNEQLTGKGQRGNSWESTPGKNLTFSFLLKPHFISIYQQFDLNLCISLGIIDALNQFESGFQVKWPNDIYFHDKKVCGILIQNFLKQHQIESSIVGIGLNVNQTEFNVPTATSIAKITGRNHKLTEVLELLCMAIEARYLQLRSGKKEALKEAYLNNMYWFGEDHIFKAEKPFSGRIVGITTEGRLEVETRKGLESFAMKEIAFIH